MRLEGTCPEKLDRFEVEDLRLVDLPGPARSAGWILQAAAFLPFPDLPAPARLNLSMG
jgi:hypothetical protein